MATVRKRPVIAHAWRVADLWTAHAATTLPPRVKLGHEQGLFVFVDWGEGRRGLMVKTLEGDMSAGENDWLIQGIKGEFYPCKPDIFDKSYEMVDESDCPMPGIAAAV
jgi:hypothetical protein